MLERIKDEWRVFAGEAPGARFERHHERIRGQGDGLLGRAIWLAAGAFFVLAGVVMLFTPGPGLLSIGFGLVCLSRESRGLARSCDRAEMRIRQAWSRWRSKRE